MMKRAFLIILAIAMSLGFSEIMLIPRDYRVNETQWQIRENIPRGDERGDTYVARYLFANFSTLCELNEAGQPKTAVLVVSVFVVGEHNGRPIGTWYYYFPFVFWARRNGSHYYYTLSYHNYTYSGGSWNTISLFNMLFQKATVDAPYVLFGFGGGKKDGTACYLFVGVYSKGGDLVFLYTLNLDTWYNVANNWKISYRPSEGLMMSLSIWAYFPETTNFTERSFWIQNSIDPDPELVIPQKLSLPNVIEHVTVPTPPSDIRWEYASWSLTSDREENLEIGNGINLNVNLADGQNLFNLTAEPWHLSFTHIKLQSQTNYFTYNFTKSTSWGDWGIWNWLRDGLVAVVNVLEWIYVAIAYAFTLIINGVWCLLLLIGLFVYETLVYWLYIGVLWLGWLIFAGLFYLLYIIIQGFILLTNLLIPLTLFMFNLINSIIAFVWACIVYLFYPTGDFWQIYNNMLNVLSLFTNTLAVLIINILIYLPELISIFMYYGVFWALAYIKRMWVKSKGFSARERQLEEVIETLEMPIRVVEGLIYRIKRLIPVVG